MAKENKDTEETAQMEQSTNRKMYRQCCWYLKVLIDLGGRENVRQIIADWKAELFVHRQESQVFCPSYSFAKNR